MSVSIDPDTDQLTIRTPTSEESISLSSVTTKLRENRDQSHTVSPSDLTLTVSTAHYDIRLLLEDYAYLNPDYVKPAEGTGSDYYTISGMALVREKK